MRLAREKLGGKRQPEEDRARLPECAVLQKPPEGEQGRTNKHAATNQYTTPARNPMPDP